MINGCGFAPGVEFGHAFRHRPPHATRTAEVVGWARVVNRSAVGRCNHALEGLQWFGDVKVSAAQLLDCVIAESLHPLLQFICAVKFARLVVVQNLDGLLNRCARLNFAGNCFLLCRDSGQLFATPLVGLIEIYLGAQEAAAE